MEDDGEDGTDGGASVLHAATLEGAQASVAALAVAETAAAEGAAGASVVAAGEWEGGLSLWDVRHEGTYMRELEEEDDEEDEGGAGGPKRASSAPVLQPAVRFGRLHRGAVSGASFGAGASGLGASGAVLATCAWDRSLCLWDTERLLAGGGGEAPAGGGALSLPVPPEALRQRIAVGKTPTGLTTGPSGQQLATSHSDGTARVWDPRSSASASAGSDKAGAAVVLRHKGLPWVSAVAWHPQDRHLLLSAAHDGACRAWDLRATRAPLYALRHEWPGAGAAGDGRGAASGAGSDDSTKAGPKLLACAWSGADAAVSGGEDRRVMAWGMRGRSLGAGV